MAFFGLLKNKQKKFDDAPIIKDNTMEINDPSKPDPIAQMMASIPDGSSKERMNTYDILVFEQQPDGSKKQKAVNGVKARSKRDLAALYAADGAQIQILKEYGEEPRQQAPAPSVPNQSMPAQFVAQPRPTIQFTQYNEPPKFFEIGGIKCKLEGGKMYQEQWVRVDASKYRLVSDNTNKLCPMSGKHLETLKWVQIENKEETETKNA